jgi:hypothetical protein
VSERALEPQVVESRDDGDSAPGSDLDQVGAQEEEMLDMDDVRLGLGKKLVEGLPRAPVPDAEERVAPAAAEGEEAHPLAALGARPGDRICFARRAEDKDFISPPLQFAGQSRRVELRPSVPERRESMDDEKDAHAAA